MIDGVQPVLGIRKLPQRNKRSKGSAILFVPKLPSLSAVEKRNGISPIPFSKKCARGARLLAISRGRDRAFFCNHSPSRHCLSWAEDEDGKIGDILPDAHCTIDVDGKTTIGVYVEQFAQARELIREQWFRDGLCQLTNNSVPLCTASSKLTARYATEDERVLSSAIR
jgi:hypothetical protein